MTSAATAGTARIGRSLGSTTISAMASTPSPAADATRGPCRARSPAPASVLRSTWFLAPMGDLRLSAHIVRFRVTRVHGPNGPFVTSPGQMGPADLRESGEIRGCAVDEHGDLAGTGGAPPALRRAD